MKSPHLSGHPRKKKGVSENGDPQMATLWSINSLLLKMAIYSWFTH